MLFFRLIQCSKGKVQKFLVESLKVALTSNSNQDSGRKHSADVSETFQSIDLASDTGDNSELVKAWQSKLHTLL